MIDSNNFKFIICTLVFDCIGNAKSRYYNCLLIVKLVCIRGLSQVILSVNERKIVQIKYDFLCELCEQEKAMIKYPFFIIDFINIYE